MPAGSEVDQAKCGICHTNPPKRNEFGSIVEKAMGAKGKSVADDEIMGMVGEMKSPDGRSFKEVIEGGANPVTVLGGAPPPASAKR